MRLIDADDLLEAIKQGFIEDADDAIHIVTNAPTIQREGWVSVDDRLPRDYESPQMYLINNSGFVTVGFFYSDIKGWSDSKRVFITKQVTHWQPLPAAPTDTEK